MKNDPPPNRAIIELHLSRRFHRCTDPEYHSSSITQSRRVRGIDIVMKGCEQSVTTIEVCIIHNGQRPAKNDIVVRIRMPKIEGAKKPLFEVQPRRHAFQARALVIVRFISRVRRVGIALQFPGLVLTTAAQKLARSCSQRKEHCCISCICCSLLRALHHPIRFARSSPYMSRNCKSLDGRSGSKDEPSVWVKSKNQLLEDSHPRRLRDDCPQSENRRGFELESDQKGESKVNLHQTTLRCTSRSRRVG